MMRFPIWDLGLRPRRGLRILSGFLSLLLAPGALQTQDQGTGRMRADLKSQKIFEELFGMKKEAKIL